MNDTWWVFYVGTVVLIIMSGSIVVIFILHQRQKLNILRESEQKYSDLFNNVSDIIYIHALDGEISEINDSAPRMLGYPKGEILHHNIKAFINGKYLGNLNRYLDGFKGGAEEQVGRVLLFSKNKRTYHLLEYRSSAIKDQNGKRVAIRGVARDVTEQDRTERSLAKSTWRAKKLLVEATVMRKNIDLISRELIRVHEEESGRISRELHDEVGQLLTSITLNLKMLDSYQTANPVKYKQMITDTKALSDQVFTKIRSYLRELRPAALDSLGLIPAIRQLANQFAERTGIEVSIIGDDTIDCLDAEQMNVLYRIVQESLTNIAKHAEAQSVTVMIENHMNNVMLEIDDDGVGFDPEKIKINQFERKNLGILGMQERVRLISGEFQLKSREGEGTSIMVKIPVNTGKGGDGEAA